ncbi:MAG: AAA family ATPase, partial [Coleofasciculus sp.]
YIQQPFEGREEEQRQLDEFVQHSSRGVLLVTGAAGFGKSALLSHWQESQQEDCFIAYHCFSYRYQKTRLVSEAYRHLLKQLYLYHNIRNGQFPNDPNQMRDILVGMLEKPVSPEGKRLVIVLDGLDEASEPLEPFFTRLPDGVFVIASARAEVGDEPEYLRNWTDNAQRLYLNRLRREAIPKWLGQISELVTYSQNQDFVQRLDEITGGFPLYLRYLIDELRQAAKKGQDVQGVLRNSPGGFKAYVKEQFRQLAKVDEIKRQREVRELFALLSVALGALSEDDIEALTALNAWDLADLPWQATRWFSIQTGCYSFAHPLLAQEFKGALGHQASLAEAKLIDYCAKWQEYHSSYGLRYYAEHLGKAKRWQELYAIARNPDFAATQLEQLPDEPNLPLKTVQIALQGAAEEDKAEKMAEFVLVHAHRLGQTNAQESPLEALRSGSLKRAWVLANQYEIEHRILWYLLLAWELKDEGKLDDARETLERLQQKNLPSFQLNWATDWLCEYATYFLAHIFEVSEETCLALHQRLFEYSASSWLCMCLLKLGKVQAALTIAERIILELKQFFPLRDILEAQLEKGNSQETQIVFAKVLEITRQIFPSYWWAWWMGDIAKAQIKLEHREEARATFSEALEATHKIENQKARMRTLIDIANYQADAALFSDARETLQRIEFQCDLEDDWIYLAEAQAKIGDREQSRISLSQAKQFAWNIEDNVKYIYLSRIASKQAEIGELADALKSGEELTTIDHQSIEGLLLWIVSQEECDDRIFISVLETAKRIYDNSPDYYKDMILQEIVAVQAQKAERWQEDFTDAITTALQIKDKRCKAQSLLTIVKAQTKLRWFDQAVKTANMIDIPDNQTDKDEALIEIIKGQVTAGQFEDAFTLGSNIRGQNKQEDALVEIATAYAHAKNFSQALKITNGLFNPWKKLKLFNSIATIQSQIDLAKEARDTFAMGLKKSLADDVSYQSASSLLNVAELLLLSDQNEKGLAYANAKDVNEIAKNINELSQKVNVLAWLGEVYAKVGQRNEVKCIFTEAIDIVQKVEQQNYPNPNHIDWSMVELFTTIGIAQAKAEEFDAALETVQKIKLIGHKALVLKTLAQVHPEAEQRERLKTDLTTIHENALRSWNWVFDHAATTLSWIAVAWLELGERQAALDIWAEACEIIEQEKTQTIRTKPDSLLSTVAVAQAKAGEITLAWENTNKIEDGWTQVKTLSDIASCQWNKGDQDGLSATLNTVFKAKEKITDEQKQLNALWMIAQIQVMAGQVEQAFNTAEKVLIEQNKLFLNIASILAKLKDKNRFKMLLIPCAYSLNTAYNVCISIAYLYPEKAEAVAEIIKKFALSST